MKHDGGRSSERPRPQRPQRSLRRCALRQARDAAVGCVSSFSLPPSPGAAGATGSTMGLLRSATVCVDRHVSRPGALMRAGSSNVMCAVLRRVPENSWRRHSTPHRQCGARWGCIGGALGVHWGCTGGAPGAPVVQHWSRHGGAMATGKRLWGCDPLRRVGWRLLLSLLGASLSRLSLTAPTRRTRAPHAPLTNV